MIPLLKVSFSSLKDLTRDGIKWDALDDIVVVPKGNTIDCYLLEHHHILRFKDSITITQDDSIITTLQLLSPTRLLIALCNGNIQLWHLYISPLDRTIVHYIVFSYNISTTPIAFLAPSYSTFPNLFHVQTQTSIVRIDTSSGLENITSQIISLPKSSSSYPLQALLPSAHEMVIFETPDDHDECVTWWSIDWNRTSSVRIVQQRPILPRALLDVYYHARSIWMVWQCGMITQCIADQPFQWKIKSSFPLCNEKITQARFFHSISSSSLHVVTASPACWTTYAWNDDLTAWKTLKRSMYPKLEKMMGMKWDTWTNTAWIYCKEFLFLLTPNLHPPPPSLDKVPSPCLETERGDNEIDDTRQNLNLNLNLNSSSREEWKSLQERFSIPIQSTTHRSHLPKETSFLEEPVSTLLREEFNQRLFVAEQQIGDFKNDISELRTSINAFTATVNSDLRRIIQRFQSK